MNTEEQAREDLTRQRQDKQHRQENMLSRAEAELAMEANHSPKMDEKGREMIAEHRRQDKQRQESMSQRTEGEFKH